MKKLRITQTDFMLADSSTNQRIQFSAQCFRKKGIIREGYKKNELRRSRGGSHTNHIINNTKTNNQSLLST